MDTLALIKQPIEAELTEYRSIFCQVMQHSNPLLNFALQHVLQRPGKMLRPILMLLTAKAFGAVNRNVLLSAACLEMIHTASLVHDDVVDESDRRRGQASVNKLLNSKAAVLVGDYLFAKALELASEVGDFQVIAALSGLTERLSVGELVQLSNLDSKEMSYDAYYEVIKNKTASLFGISSHLGSYLVNAGREQQECMRLFGEYLGIAFQIRDDIFDYDKTHDVGKPAGNDMHEGKLTLPAIYAVSRAGEESHWYQIAMRVRQGEATQAEIDQLVNFTIEQGGIDYAREEMYRFATMASQQLTCVQNSDVRQSLQTFCDFISARQI